MNTLTSAQRQHLKGLAHTLSPVVIIGDKGLTEAVVKEIGAALKAHELIKIKAGSSEKEMRNAWLEQLCATLHASAVQHIGKMLVVYKAAEEPLIKLP